jgi:periplasmic divalent cation tolerance protein
MTNIIVFMTTVTKPEAQRIVQSLLEKRLIACANIFGPVESHFWWQSKIERAEEFLVLMKSNRKLFPKLTKAVNEIHSYDVPEILAVSITEGFPLYLKWMNSVLTSSGES